MSMHRLSIKLDCPTIVRSTSTFSERTTVTTSNFVLLILFLLQREREPRRWHTLLTSCGHMPIIGFP